MRAKALAIALPKPRPDPVTNATLPLSESLPDIPVLLIVMSPFQVG
jgi:hypothetical protein